MYKILRIISCLLAVACAVVCIFIFVYFGWWGLVCLIGGCAFAGLMFLFKNLQLKEELKANPPPPKPDFITGGVKPTTPESEKNTSDDSSETTNN